MDFVLFPFMASPDGYGFHETGSDHTRVYLFTGVALCRTLTFHLSRSGSVFGKLNLRVLSSHVLLTFQSVALSAVLL